jgi:hypothetical protein
MENTGEYIAFVRFPWLVADKARQAVREYDKKHHQPWWNHYCAGRACLCVVHGVACANKTVESG